MHRTVPMARRSLFHDGRRAALSIAGIAVALLLVLVLDGIFAGAMERVTAYIRGLPADLVVSQRGVRTMHMSSSSLPADTVAQARAVPGVAWAETIRFTTVVVASDRGSQLSYVIGVEPGGRGGPAGSSPATRHARARSCSTASARSSSTPASEAAFGCSAAPSRCQA